MCIFLVKCFKNIFLLDPYCKQSMDPYVEHDGGYAFFLYQHEDGGT